MPLKFWSENPLVKTFESPHKHLQLTAYVAAVLRGTGLSKLLGLSKLQFDLLIRNINLQVKVMC